MKLTFYEASILVELLEENLNMINDLTKKQGENLTALMNNEEELKIHNKLYSRQQVIRKVLNQIKDETEF